VTDHRAGGGRLFLVEFRHQLRRSFSPPFTEPGVVLMNASLVLVLWFWVPIGLRDLFISLHGEMALPMVLASWMYADVPATNLLAPDRERALAVLDRPADLQRLIDAKNVVLWFLVSPVCIALAIGTGIAAANGIRISDAPAPTHSAILPATAIAVLWIAVAPLGALGIASWIGTWFPYHPLPLRTRFQHRRPLRHMVVRWIALLLIPYGVVPALTALVAIPSLLYWHVTGSFSLTEPIRPGQFALGTCLTALVSVTLWLVGRRVGRRFVVRRRTQLRAYLSDPLAG
jgi:hypothetical protein